MEALSRKIIDETNVAALASLLKEMHRDEHGWREEASWLIARGGVLVPSVISHDAMLVIEKGLADPMQTDSTKMLRDILVGIARGTL